MRNSIIKMNFIKIVMFFFWNIPILSGVSFDQAKENCN